MKKFIPTFLLFIVLLLFLGCSSPEEPVFETESTSTGTNNPDTSNPVVLGDNLTKGFMLDAENAFGTTVLCNGKSAKEFIPRGMNSFADLPLQRTVVPKAFSASSMNPLVRLSPRTTGLLVSGLFVPVEVDSVSKTGSSGEEHPKKRRRTIKRRKVGMNFFMGVTINKIMNS